METAHDRLHFFAAVNGQTTIYPQKQISHPYV